MQLWMSTDAKEDAKKPKEDDDEEIDLDKAAAEAAEAGQRAWKAAGDAASEASSRADAAAKSAAGTFDFIRDAFYGALGLDPPMDEREGHGAAGYPWVEFIIATGPEKGERAYRHKFNHEITRVKPEDFDRFGAADAVELDTETMALAIVPEEKTHWQHYSDMLSETPLMRQVYAMGQALSDSEVGQEVSRQVRAAQDHVEDRTADIQDKWENSQHPMVHAMSDAVDTVFGQTEHSRAVSKFRELDPGFDVEGIEFRREMEQHMVPAMVEAFLKGDRLVLDAWCTPEAMERINAVLRARETEGITVDPTVLHYGYVNIVGGKMTNKGMEPRLVVSCEVQQVHCMRDREGKDVEGSKDEIRAVIYVFSLLKRMNPQKGGMFWEVDDFSFIGSTLLI